MQLLRILTKTKTCKAEICSKLLDYTPLFSLEGGGEEDVFCKMFCKFLSF